MQEQGTKVSPQTHGTPFWRTGEGSTWTPHCVSLSFFPPEPSSRLPTWHIAGQPGLSDGSEKLRRELKTKHLDNNSI